MTDRDFITETIRMLNEAGDRYDAATMQRGLDRDTGKEGHPTWLAGEADRLRHRADTCRHLRTMRGLEPARARVA